MQHVHTGAILDSGNAKVSTWLSCKSLPPRPQIAGILLNGDINVTESVTHKLPAKFHGM